MMNIEDKMKLSIEEGGVERSDIYSYLMKFGLARIALHETLKDNKESLTLCGSYKLVHDNDKKTVRAYRRKLKLKDGALTFNWVGSRVILRVPVLFIPKASLTDVHEKWVVQIVRWFLKDLVDLGVKGVSSYKYSDPYFFYDEFGKTDSHAKQTALLNTPWLTPGREIRRSDDSRAIHGRLRTFISKEDIRFAQRYIAKQTRYWGQRELIGLILKTDGINSSFCVKTEIGFAELDKVKKLAANPQLWLENPAFLPYVKLVDSDYYARKDLFQNKVFMQGMRLSGVEVNKGQLRTLLKQRKSISKAIAANLYNGRGGDWDVDRYVRLLRMDGFEEMPVKYQIKLLEKFVGIVKCFDIVSRWLKYYKDDFKRLGVTTNQVFYQRSFEQLRHVYDWYSRQDEEPQIHKNQDWVALTNKAQEWVRRINAEAIARSEYEESLTWEPALPLFDWEGVAVKELCSSAELSLEGIEMSHCVGMYNIDCHSGDYRVFSLLNGDERATLGVSIGTKGEALFCQLQTYDNCADYPPSKHMHEAAKNVILELNKEEKARKAS